MPFQIVDMHNQTADINKRPNQTADNHECPNQNADMHEDPNQTADIHECPNQTADPCTNALIRLPIYKNILIRL